MKAHWMTALVLGTAMTAGCAGSPQKTEETQVPAASAGQPADAAVPQPAALTPEAPAPVADAAAPKSAAKPAPSRPASRPAAPAASASIATPEPAPAAPPAPRVEYRDLKVAAGTALPLELITPLSSETAEV